LSSRLFSFSSSGSDFLRGRQTLGSGGRFGGLTSEFWAWHAPEQLELGQASSLG
jgi:hypothetical protein